jgi:hypothetical protein
MVEDSCLENIGLSEEEKKQRDEQLKAIAKMAENYYHTFNTEAGKKTLENLNMLTTMPRLTTQNAMLGNPVIPVSANEMMFICEGQRQMVQYIIAMMNYFMNNN